MPPVQRAAAEALGRLGDRTAVADLLVLAGSGWNGRWNTR